MEELVISIKQIIGSSLLYLIVSIFLAQLIMKFVSYWVKRVFYISRLKSMNILSEDRWVKIDGLEGVTERKGDMIKLKNENCITWIPIRRIIENSVVSIPIIKDGKKQEKR